jgi:hypothetical protein
MSTSRAIEQSRDVDSVAHLWRKLGRSPGGIAVYSGYLKRLLREARGCDFSAPIVSSNWHSRTHGGAT